VFDCLDLSDECNENCSKNVLPATYLKIFSWLIGTLTTLANMVILFKHMRSLRRSRNSIVLINKALIMLISWGDLLVGCYLITISVLDSLTFRNNYCNKQVDWITSTECSVIGVLSTIGSQVSLFAMTGLSIVRFRVILRSKRTPDGVNVVNLLLVALVIILLSTASVAIAVIPIVQRFEDFFVNGMKFSDKLRLFIGVPGKQTILSIMEAYHGRMKLKTGLSWERIVEMVQSIFSNDPGHLNHALKSEMKKVHFYGNDGVCLFKYFVKNDDPQRVFVWCVLAINFFCFLFISVSYLLVHFISRESSNSTGNHQNSKRMKNMNRKISLMIATDFICWIPFIIICALHSIEVMDATQFYGLFSVIILPINSLINPFLYDDFLTRMFRDWVEGISIVIWNSAAVHRFRSSVGAILPETIELDHIEIEGHAVQ
jgi:hypothetical protein